MAGAAALPLLIHLLFRRKPQKVRFPMVRFIRQSRGRSFRRTWFKRLLLLLLRMGLLALLALLIARPALGGGPAGPEAGKLVTPAAALVIDDSLSMQYAIADTSWFDRARSRALELVEGLRGGPPTALITTSQPAAELVDTAEKVAGRLRRLRPTMRSDSCWAALRAAADLLPSEGGGRLRILLLTDMTVGAWMGWEGRKLDLGPRVDLFIVDCSEEGASNGGLTAIRHRGGPALRGGVVELEASILAGGGPLERTLQFEFDGRPICRRKVELEGGQTATERCTVRLAEAGHHGGSARFLTPDGLPADDRRAFTLEVAPDVRVLCVEDEPESERDSASYFFRLALNPWREPEKGIFRVDRAYSAELEEQPLEPFDAVALVGAGDVSPGGWRRLARHLGGGGALVVFCGPATGENYHADEALGVLGTRVGAVVDAGEEEPFAPRTVRAGHPFVEALEASGTSLSGVRFLKCRRLNPSSTAEEVLSFGPGLPALVLDRRGGRVAVFASTADDRWGLFARTPGYVPFCRELLLHMTGREAGGVRSYPVGAQVPILFEPSEYPTIVEVTPPGAGASERLMPGATPGRRSYWDTDLPGYYRVEFERQDRRWTSGFAVNTAATESRLEKVPLRRLKTALQAGRVELLEDEAVSRGPVREGGRAHELTPYVALAALLLLVAEGFVANRFYPAASAEQGEETA